MSAIETAPARISWTASETTPSISEDWLSVIIGLFIVVLALAAPTASRAPCVITLDHGRPSDRCER